MLKNGAQVSIDQSPGDETRVYLPHPETRRARTRSHAPLDDGKVLRAVEVAAARRDASSRRQALGA